MTTESRLARTHALLLQAQFQSSEKDRTSIQNLMLRRLIQDHRLIYISSRLLREARAEELCKEIGAYQVRSGNW